jgi:PTH1 family peptidyl-tRNA hydrolase
MNKSGDSLKSIKDLKLKTVGKGKEKRTEVGNLVVIHDDLDIPFGKYKISFNKSSGGHHGVESIMKVVKTEGFVRVRVGIASSASAVTKSQEEKAVEKIILGKFTPDQIAELKKMSKRISEGLACFVTDGRNKAMSQYQG